MYWMDGFVDGLDCVVGAKGGGAGRGRGRGCSRLDAQSINQSITQPKATTADLPSPSATPLASTKIPTPTLTGILILSPDTSTYLT